MNKDTTLDTALRRVTAIAALVFVLGSSASADDFLLLRDGSQKRGALSACDQNSCRLGTEWVPRANVAWIGLGRDAPTPPAARDAARDELHLVNRSVQSVTLNGVDAGFVHTTLGGRGFQAASSLPRASVAWIHLGRPEQGSHDPAAYDPVGKQKTGTKGKDEETKQDTAGAPWRLPSRVYIFIPRRCPGCEATLHVLDFRQEGENVLLRKSRTISVSDGLLTGHWFAYDPPVPVFPATTDVARFAFDGQRKTNVTSEFYLQNRGSGAGASGGTGAARSGSGVPRGPGGPGIGPSVEPFRKSIDRAVEEARESAEDWWRDRMAQDRAAAQGGTAGTAGSGGAGGGGARQHAVFTGAASYNETLRIQNWLIIAGEFVKRRDPGWEPYGKLQKIPVYDVEFDLRFSWRDRSGRGRDVDTEGYTTDWSEGAGGSRRQVPENTPGIPQQSPQQEADSGITVDWLIGDRFQSAREGAASLQRRVESAQESAREAAAGVRDQADAARRGAADLFNYAMGGGIGAPDNQQRAGTMSGTSHAVTLHMRWFREQGRITEYTGDILRHVVEGRDEHFDDIRVSSTLPLAAFDMQRPPLWTPPNPKPPPARSQTGPGWFRP